MEEECRNNMLITRYGLIAEMLRLMIEFRNSVKKTKDGLFHRISQDSILKSRDITLPIKVCLVKAMVFPVVMYGCESWTVKKAEHQRIDAFEL